MEPSFFLQASFIILPLGIVGIAAWMGKSPRLLIVMLLWMTFTASIAIAGIARDFESSPPPLLLILIPAFTVTVFAATRAIGNRFKDLPLAWLIGFSVFRLPLELMIHQAVKEGIAPPQFTWTGLNYDIVTAITALLLFPFASRVPQMLTWLWNIVGVILLTIVFTIAVISAPGRLQLLKPDNTWVADFPFIWLPSVCVVCALFNHVVIFRKLIDRKPTD